MAEEHTPTALLVEIWSDVVCPWCYIGKRRFEGALSRLADQGTDISGITVAYRAFQLDPSPRPADTPPMMATEMYARKFGGPERAEAILEHLTTVAAADGLEFHLDRAIRANTFDAHRLLWLAEQADNVQPVNAMVQSELNELLMQAYFTDGLDISDRDTLAQLATTAGANTEAVTAFLDGNEGELEVRSMIDHAVDLGITGVPAYVINRSWTIPGAQDIDVFVQVLTRLLSQR